MVQLAAGAALWLAALVGVAAHQLRQLAPLLHRPLAHATVIVGAALLASASGIGVAGWLSAAAGRRAPRRRRLLGGRRRRLPHAYALLVPLAVVPITLYALSRRRSRRAGASTPPT